MPDILSGVIWVQTVCKDYQQTTVAGKDLKKDYAYVTSTKVPPAQMFPVWSVCSDLKEE